MKLDNKSKLVLAIVAVIFVVFNVIFLLAADTAGINNTTIVSWVFMVLYQTRNRKNYVNQQNIAD